jgi:hypothetical protein
MLFYLFSAEELEEIFKDLGYHFEYETIPKNIDYYLNAPLTDQRSAGLSMHGF